MFKLLTTSTNHHCVSGYSMRKANRCVQAVLVLSAALLTTVLVGGCSSTDKKEEKPAKLASFTKQLSVQRVWHMGLGGKSDHLRLALRVAVADGVAYAGGYSGKVMAVDVATGAKRWDVKTKLPLSAGPGIGQASDGKTVLIFGSSDGILLALNASDGTERWRHRVPSEVLATPLVIDGEVIVRTGDDHVTALSADDAKAIWNYDQAVPKLSLRGNAPPVVAGGSIIVPFDNGRVASLDIKSGDAQWDTAVGTSVGRSELQRMVDIDGAVTVSEDDVFVAAYQSRIAMLARDSGQIWWARDFSSYRGLAVDSSTLYASNASGEVIGMRRNDGTVTWEQKAMRLRGLTAPVLDDQRLIVGDYDGYVHWLSVTDGALLARMSTDGERISNPPLVVDGMVLVQTDAGSVVAFKAVPKT
jgi:outer membrane protein assembly factor BamB